MRLRYETTMDDLITFNEFHIAHSPTMKRVVTKDRWSGALAIFILACFIGVQKNIVINTTAAFIMAGIFALIYPYMLRLRIKRQVLKLYSEGNNQKFLGEHELEIAEDGIIERSEYSESKTAWGAVERIEATPEHTFIYVSSISAHIIPHNRVVEGDYKTFLSELGQRFQPGQRLQSAAHLSA